LHETPVCIAKTQYSFSDDPTKLGAPSGFTLHVRDILPAAGAGFVVALAGDIMTCRDSAKARRPSGSVASGWARSMGLFLVNAPSGVDRQSPESDRSLQPGGGRR